MTKLNKIEIKKAMKYAFFPAIVMAIILFFYFEITFYLQCFADMLKQLIGL